jgi:hypothetical protein
MFEILDPGVADLTRAGHLREPVDDLQNIGAGLRQFQDLTILNDRGG